MKGNLAEKGEVQFFLSQDGKAIIQQDESIIHLDREQIETVIKLLKLAKFELKNFSIDLF